MGHNVKLIVPTDNQLELAPLIGRINGRWGGCTISDGTGWWSDSEGNLIQDKLSVIECSIGLWDHEARDWWYDISDVVKAEWDQECVFLSVTEEIGLLISDDKKVVIGG